jgi:hypothetical protein
MVETDDGIAIETNEEHPVNNPVSIVVIPVGKWMFINDEHDWNAYVPILITLFAIFTFTKDVHPWNAFDPIVFTLNGTNIDNKWILPAKAELFIVATLGTLHIYVYILPPFVSYNLYELPSNVVVGP